MVEGGLREICYDCEHYCKEHKTVYILKVSFTPCFEVLIFLRQVDNKSRRLVKNAQMQGDRNAESGVATNKERLLATPASR